MSLTIEHGPILRGRQQVLEAGTIRALTSSAIAIVGINGSGKSSLFMCLTDSLASRGHAAVSVDGRPATLAAVPQEPTLPGWLRTEHVAEMHGLAFDNLVRDMPGLHLSEIAGRRASRLSVGQKQTLSIAIALGRGADVTLLDEPFSALDFRRRLGTLDLLKQGQAEGRAFMVSSQSAADLTDLCDRFVVIRDGRYMFDGMRDDLGGPDARAVEHSLLRLLTMPVPAMEAPSRAG